MSQLEPRRLLQDLNLLPSFSQTSKPPLCLVLLCCNTLSYLLYKTVLKEKEKEEEEEVEEEAGGRRGR